MCLCNKINLHYTDFDISTVVVCLKGKMSLQLAINSFNV